MSILYHERAPIEPEQPTAKVKASATTTSSARPRIAAIDVMRGLIMLIMLIMLFDHVREAVYLHVSLTDPLSVTSTEPMLFFTRIAAHFRAPIFVFLSGLSAWLYAHPAAGPRSATGFPIHWR